LPQRFLLLANLGGITKTAPLRERFRKAFITYEVLFSYDNSYYTHCYHQTVKEYKSNGSLIRSKTDYYQAIGG
jgi:hypothetical protein